MNARNTNTFLPQSLIRQARERDSAPATPLASPDPVVSFAGDAPTVPAELLTTALNARNEVKRRDLAPLLKLVTWIFQPMAARKSILLRLEAPEIGLYVTCQEVRIQRVLENLLSNALRHSPPNSSVTLAARMEEGRLCVWVDDQGAGVPLAEQADLFCGQELSFGEYAMGANQDARGLVSAKDIVSAHGGEILMHNRIGGGSHFEFRLPAQNSRQEPNRAGYIPAHAQVA